VLLEIQAASGCAAVVCSAIKSVGTTSIAAVRVSEQSIARKLPLFNKSPS
jgi:hypothetical protein